MTGHKQVLWSERHRNCWWCLRKVPDVLAGAVVVLLLLYLVTV